MCVADIRAPHESRLLPRPFLADFSLSENESDGIHDDIFHGES